MHIERTTLTSFFILSWIKVPKALKRVRRWFIKLIWTKVDCYDWMRASKQKLPRHLINPRWLSICILCFTCLSALCSPSAWVSQVHPEHLASITLCHMQIIVGRYFENISTLYLSIYRDVCIIDVSIFNLKYGLMFPNMS